MNQERRGPWYLLTGLVIGLGLGFLYGWVLSPVSYTDTQPATLRQDFKQEYIVQIALAYAATGDAVRTQGRLALFQDPDLAQTITALAQRALADGRPEQEVRALGQLASAASLLIGSPAETSQPANPPVQAGEASPQPASPTLPPPTATPSLTPEPTQTLAPSPTASLTLNPSPTVGEGSPSPTVAPPTATLPPSPTPTPTATQGQPYILQARRLVCDPALTPPLLIVRTRDSAGTPVPGVEIIVTAPDGLEQRFFTGLKAELGLDYADFTMKPEVRYTLRLADGSQRITDITPERCSVQGVDLWGSIEVIFVQP